MSDGMPLLWVLRDLLGLTGTKYGCGIEVCGACTVLVDGQREHSCVFDATPAGGKKVVTIEGLSPDNSHPAQKAWIGKQTFVGGAAQGGNFNTNRMIRPSEMPKVLVEIIANPAAPSRTTPIGGVGELGVPTLAPALANAHFRKTGTRVRALPFFPTATMGGL